MPRVLGGCVPSRARGGQLFKYRDEDGQIHKVTREMINRRMGTPRLRKLARAFTAH